MPGPNILTKLNTITAQLTKYKLLDCTNIDIHSSGWSRMVSLTAEWTELTDLERRNFKLMFHNNFEVKDSYSGKDLNAKREITVEETGDIINLNGTITAAYTCKTLTPEEVEDLSQNERHTIWEQAEAGVIKFQQCTPAATVLAAREIEATTSNEE